jgi:hypothetical protein
MRDSRLELSCGECRQKWFLIGLFTLLSLTACRTQKTSKQTDLVIRNANVYTADSQRPWIDTVAIKVIASHGWETTAKPQQGSGLLGIADDNCDNRSHKHRRRKSAKMSSAGRSHSRPSK